MPRAQHDLRVDLHTAIGGAATKYLESEESEIGGEVSYRRHDNWWSWDGQGENHWEWNEQSVRAQD